MADPMTSATPAGFRLEAGADTLAILRTGLFSSLLGQAFHVGQLIRGELRGERAGAADGDRPREELTYGRAARAHPEGHVVSGTIGGAADVVAGSACK